MSKRRQCLYTIDGTHAGPMSDGSTTKCFVVEPPETVARLAETERLSVYLATVILGPSAWPGSSSHNVERRAGSLMRRGDPPQYKTPSSGKSCWWGLQLRAAEQPHGRCGTECSPDCV